MDHIVSKIDSVYQNSCKNSFGTHKHVNKSKYSNEPKWFDRNCKEARTNFHRAKYVYKTKKSESHRLNIKSTSKIYKKTIKQWY